MPSRKRKKRENDDDGSLQRENDFSFSNYQDFATESIFGLAGNDGLSLIKYEGREEQELILRSLQSTDLKIRRKAEETVTLAAKAAETIENGIQVCETELMKAHENLTDAKDVFITVQSFLKQAKGIQGADCLEPEHHTIDSVRKICIDVDFVHTAPKTIATKFNVHSISDFQEFHRPQGAH